MFALYRSIFRRFDERLLQDWYLERVVLCRWDEGILRRLLGYWTLDGLSNSAHGSLVSIVRCTLWWSIVSGGGM